MLCYNKSFLGVGMSAVAPSSLLSLSGVLRLALVALLILGLWGAIHWAIILP
ncbi:hypothetical protein HMPREF0201_03725 [Cedecea davisae DSM 4568]|uniref:Uncharacterized protein n=1 Tax=Cedecea davisae DSM 4568 TaxID=566551 RepID=S3IM87_9ENTR|nr:hypothetical protein HMPREF0201_03725 [Cedecea davisae DSM 4568]